MYMVYPIPLFLSSRPVAFSLFSLSFYLYISVFLYSSRYLSRSVCLCPFLTFYCSFSIHFPALCSILIPFKQKTCYRRPRPRSWVGFRLLGSRSPIVNLALHKVSVIAAGEGVGTKYSPTHHFFCFFPLHVQFRSLISRRQIESLEMWVSPCTSPSCYKRLLTEEISCLRRKAVAIIILLIRIVLFDGERDDRTE